MLYSPLPAVALSLYATIEPVAGILASNRRTVLDRSGIEHCLASPMLLLLPCVVAVARGRHASGRHTSRRPRPREVTRERAPRSMDRQYRAPGISRGYCGVTLAQSDCATSSMGAWSESNPNPSPALALVLALALP